ncbi:G5 domain-containing protein [Facklamia hominis]
MEKNYRYAIRKTTLGVGSVAIAAILAGQVQTVKAQEVDLPQETVQAQNKAVTDSAPVDKEQEANDSEVLALSDENVPTAVAQAQTSEPNYSEEEKNIKDYDGSNRYKETDLQPGDTNQTLDKNDQKVEKDGFKFESSNPAADSKSKTQYGYEITIDKKTGQRTYTKVTVTDSGLIPVNPGDKPMMNQGDKLTAESPGVTYKPIENTELTTSGRQRNLNYEASEETLKHINSKDNESTSFGFKDNYTTNNPGTKFFGDNFGITYKVNPWPNENDKLQELKLNGQYNEKVFVKGQDIDTGVKVDNIDASAKERLVGQVYHPITGEIVPGARAYIGDDGNIHIQMPQGALKQDETGKYVVNEESIFSTDDYKGLQSLDVKFFARPRTKGEFENVANMGEEWDKGTYVETGAGTADINHKGTNVTIDKQGIDRYDHYNLIGGFKLNLDDTRYYTQKFEDQNGDETANHKFSRVYPGDDFEVKIIDPSADETDKTRKTGSEMDGAYSRGEASGKLNSEFLEVANRQIAENLGVDYDDFISNDAYKDYRWSIDGKTDNISYFKIHAPKNAKAGDFLAVPVEYTYTNGSTDTHWFHFVVQETNNNRPEYLAEVGPQGNTLVNNPIVPQKDEDLKKNQPESYELIGNTFKDNKGHTWNVSIDEKTGAVTATLPLNETIQGGEKLTVPVRVKYTDQATGKEKTEEIKAQFIATRQYKTQTSEKLTSEIPFETKVEYDPNLPEGYFQEFQAGHKGELTTTFIQDTLNGKKGLFQTDGTFIEGARKIESTVTREATPRIIKIGTMPASTTIEIPFDTEYEVDHTLAAGETQLVNDGEKGEVTITTSREKDGTVKINKEITKVAKNKKIKIGTKTQGQIVDTDKIPFKYKVEFDPDFYKNYPDATENFKIVTPGKEGENKKTWTIVNSQKVGEPEIEIIEPVDAVIKVGQKDYTGTVTKTIRKEIPFTVRVVENPELEAGKSNVKQEGQPGSRTYEYSGEIFNGGLKEGTELKRTELEDQYVAPTEHIIEIGTKPVKNSESITNEVDVKVNYIYDKDKEIGYLEVQDLVKGKVTTVVENEFDPKTGQIKTVEKTVVEPGTRTVIIGIKNKEGDFTEEINKIIPFETIIQFDDNLAAGTKETVQIGENGATRQTITRTIVNGEVTEEKASEVEIVKEVKNQIIKVGTMTDGEHSYTEKLPFETKVVKVSDLKKGEWRYKKINGEEQKGKLGSRTTEWTIVNSKVTNTNIVSEEKPVDAIIEIGDADFTGNVSHEVTEALPFDVKIVEDPNMIAGTSEIVTQGVAGSKTTKYTQAIKNGEKDGDLQSEVTDETKPTQQVIKVGTKPAENNKDYSKEVGVKVEYVYDSSLKMGVFKDGGLTPGKVETKIVNKYDPTTGEITTTEEEVVTEAVQKIIVGTQDFTGKYPYESTTEIPFKVIVKEDPNLAKGQSRVEQEGKAGSKTTYYEIAIKNGEKVGDPRITNVVENDQPQDHIIYVGTAVAKSSTVEIVEKDIPFETKITYDENLDAGSQVVDKEGVVGKEKVTITTNITDGTGTTSTTTETIKEKIDREIRVGTKPVVKEVEKPFNTEYIYDENLESGKTEEVTPGKNGKVTITTTYDKDQKKVVTSETEEKGQNRVVKIGGKTNGTEKVKEEIPFEVEVRKDPSLKKGEWKYATDDEGNELKGEKGEQERTLTIENSKVTNTSKPTVTKKAKNAVILVGEGTNDGTHEVVEKKEIPFETRYEYDDSLKPGEEKVVTPGSPGEQERTNTLVIKDGKVVETKEGEFKTTKEPQERLIKIGRKSTEGETTKTIEREIPYETKVIYDDTLEAGSQKIEKEGKSGKEEVTITQKVKDSKPDGEPTETTKTITEKEDRVVRIGIKPVVKETELGHDTEYRHNPELKEGETKVIEEGSKGSVKYTTTFNKETGKLEITEERTEPKNKVVEYGSKTDGEFKFESEKSFDIKVVEDPNMEAGKTEVIQEGKPGKTETTVKIENSKEVSRETKTITEKQDKIIKVGTKNVCEIPPVDPEDPKPEDPKPEDPKPEDPKPEDPKPEDPKPEDPKPEDPKPEDPKPEDPKPEDPKPEDPKPEDPKPEDPKPEDPKPEDPKPEDPKPEDPKPEDPKPEDPKPEDPKPEDPEKPGKPSEPGASGETPENPEDPGKPGEEDPKFPTNPANDPSTGEVEKAMALPQTGEASDYLFGAAALSVLSGIGLIANQRRKKEEEE